MHPMRYTHQSIYTRIGTSLSINVLAGVDICDHPSLIILSQNKGHHFTLMRSISGEPLLNFDANNGEINEGEFIARIRIICDSDPSKDFVFDQIVIVVPASNLLLSESHSFSAAFLSPQANAESVDKPHTGVCLLENLTHDNVGVFEPSFLDNSSGLMIGGQTVASDSSSFKIRCGEQDWTPFLPYPEEVIFFSEDQQPNNVCPGIFNYEYFLNADGTFSSKLSSLSARASGQPSSFCLNNQFTNATLITKPKAGSISDFDAHQGTFLYTSFTPSVSPDVDSFNFTLTCTASPFNACKATARISILPAPDNSTIYHDKSNLITCKGSCVKGNSTRKDGRAVGSIDFNYSESGNLLIYAYMTLNSLQSHFVTFSPFVNGSGYLTSASAPNDTLVSFEPSCLDRQSTEGRASDVVLADGGGLNLLTDNYRLGDNYYQKFGGLHQQCDIYREDSCKFAPFMTPNTQSKGGGTPTVTWELYIDGCDATYVGTASVESLRALQNPDGTATFRLTGDTTLRGTVYMNRLTPVSLESPEQGFVISHKPHDVNVTIRSTITVHTSEVKEAGDGAVRIVSDIQYTFGKDIVTNERLYAYSVHMYPRRMVDNRMISVDTHDVSMQSSSLVYFEFASPNGLECTECTGTRMRCKGLGLGFETDCGTDGIVTFEAYNAAKFSSSDYPRTRGNPYVFPRIISDIGSYYELIFTLRVNGRNSYNSVDAAPVGSFVIHVRLSNGQVFSVKVDQSDYVSLINNHYLLPQMCTASPYWPVPDVLGSSTPANPFKPLSFANDSGVVVMDDYSTPKQLTNASMCHMASIYTQSSIYPSSLSAILPKGAMSERASLCAYEQEYIFGVKDWVFVTIPSIKEKQDGTLVTPKAFLSTAYTVAELQYVFLRVPLNETIASEASDLRDNEDLIILLEGSATPGNELFKVQADGYPFASPQMGRYYSWKEVAPFLKYRHLSYNEGDSGGQTVTVPFNFAFSPGPLLHHGSSMNVPIHLHVSVKFTTFEGNAGNARVINEIEDKLLYIFHVSHGISAATQFDAQAYKIAMIKLEGALGRRSATALFIFLLIAVIGTLLASIFIEAKFRGIIHRSKYHPKNSETSVGAGYNSRGDHSSDSNNLGADQNGATSILSPCASGGPLATDDNKGYSAPIKTKFCILGTEQYRVADDGDEKFIPSSRNIQHNGLNRLAINEEEKRVQDDEVAEF
ncbi:unnamed protein product [Phytomonas sp. EM1]|nr:unnamed protein product [Phytomonas sp. EM1]|eukprot:CCW62696.1 unnamed protein product [Phytomonas sp. isolate EM1]